MPHGGAGNGGGDAEGAFGCSAVGSAHAILTDRKKSCRTKKKAGVDLWQYGDGE